MNAPTLTPSRYTNAILDNIGSDFGRAARKIAAPGPNMRWLADNSAVTRRAYDEMIEEREVR